MAGSTATEPQTAAGANGNGTHPEGIDDEEAQARAAQMIGLGEISQLSFDVGGKKPDTSKVKLAGRSIELPKSQIKKGSEVTIQCRVRVTGVHFDDKIDSSTETVNGCTRKQVCRIVGDVHVIPDAE